MFFQQFNLMEEISRDLETLKANTKALNNHKRTKKTENELGINAIIWVKWIAYLYWKLGK